MAKYISIILGMFLLSARGFCASRMSGADARINAITERFYQGHRRTNQQRSRRNPPAARASEASRTPGASRAPRGGNGRYYKVSVFLADGKRIKGKIKLIGDGISIPYRKDGIDYVKNLGFNQIRFIEVVRFFMVRVSKVKEYIVYYFFAKKIKIIDKKGNIFYYNGRIRSFSYFKLINNYGIVKLRMSFYDYWNRKTKTWYIGGTSDFNSLIFSGAGKTVVKLHFHR